MTIIKGIYVSAAIVFISGLLVACSLVYLWYATPDWKGTLAAEAALFISAATFFVTSISTASIILLGWRSDVRQSNEADLKMRQLKLQIAELEQKLNKGQSLP
jgi:hypothetical protein